MPDAYPFLAQRIFNTPLALAPHKAAVVVSALQDRLGVAPPQLRRPGAFFDDFDAPARPARTGYDLVDGVATIAIDGVLVQRSGYVRPISGMTGYDGLRVNLLGALEDPKVRAIVLDIDSPGGEVGGLFDLVDLIYAARGTKPMQAILGEHAYSAAYALASATDRITVPRTGGVGSIGVLAMLTDISRAVKGAGVQVHFVHHGALKAREMRESYQGVSADLVARLQGDVDAMGELFIETVARNRGLSAARVRGQEADYFLGARGVQEGLADAVMAPDDAFLALLADLDAA